MSNKSKNLFSHLTDLEIELNNFSFEELTADEATELKKAFKTFKNDVDTKFFGNDKAVSHSKNIHAKDSSEEAMLIAKVSHEIRTPLNGIIGFTDLLKETPLTKTQENHVNAIESASQTLLHIINEILEYSKISTSLNNAELIEFDCHKLINDVAYLCKTLIVNKNIDLKVKMDNTIPKILIGDPSKLSQVLLNLMGNSIKFVENGSIQLTITQVGLTNNDVLLEFDVTDTGIGISKENLGQIFDPFKQVEENVFSKYGGTGLGLNIVKQIIENLNGEISVTSNLGQGSTFKFTLPYLKSSKKNLVKELKNTEEQEKNVEGMKILVFEDNTLNQQLIKNRLENWKCEVFLTDKPIYGLNILKNHKIDVVFMDLRMPVMDGFDITKKIRASKVNNAKNVPIIALTADFSVNDKEKCDKYGINDFILKPYAPDELLDKLIEYKNKPEDGNIKIHTTQNTQSISDNDTLVNLDSVYKDCMDDMDMLEELVGLFKQNALEFIGNIKIAIKNSDFTAIKFSTHKTKAGLKMMKTFGLSNIVENIQNNCNTIQNIKEIENLHKRFIEEYSLVEIAIDRQVQKLKGI